MTHPDILHAPASLLQPRLAQLQLGAGRRCTLASKYLPIETILGVLQETPSRLAELTDGVDEARLHVPPRPGEWSAHEVLAHLRACSEVWGGKYIGAILRVDNPAIRAINPRTWIAKTDYLDQDFAAALRAFTAQRHDLLSALQSLAPADWQRTNSLIGAGKPLQQTLLSHADGLARHERAHLRQLRRALE